MGCITASGYRLGQSIEASGHKAFPSVVVSGFNRYSPIQASAYAVCPLTSAAFVEVTPQIMWLTEANGYSGVFETKSNTNWIVEIKNK